jgi:hypothetical protein
MTTDELERLLAQQPLGVLHAAECTGIFARGSDD